jgi:hypothetical protein
MEWGLMQDSSGVHEQYRRELREVAPDVSYGFVVDSRTAQASLRVLSAVAKRRRTFSERVLFGLLSWTSIVILGVLGLGASLWLSIQSAQFVDRQFGPDAHFSNNNFLPMVTFLVVFVVTYSLILIGLRRLAKLSARGQYQYLYEDNVFLLEGRKSHLWLDERSAGAIRRWSAFDELVEFNEGIWLILRRRAKFVPVWAVLIGKDSLPGSCKWSELRDYLWQRIEEHGIDSDGGPVTPASMPETGPRRG